MALPNMTLPFMPGRMDASQEQTEIKCFTPLEPTADGFRNYLGDQKRLAPEALLRKHVLFITN